MLLYEYNIRDEFDQVYDYAHALLEKFIGGSNIDDLQADRENLEILCGILDGHLPEDLRGKTNLWRHLWWMKQWLNKGEPHACRGDIEDICNYDLPELEHLFRDSCKSAVYNDPELVQKTQNLIIQREFDSAIRRAFVILKSRLVAKFNVSDNLDGTELINAIFGSRSTLSPGMESAERQGMRDLLAGLYGTFRNKYGHNDLESSWYEADAVLSIINYILKRVDECEVS